MAKVIQEADYIKKRKYKYFIRTLISLIIMTSIFVIGFILTKTRNNAFTLISVLFTLVVAQYGVQYISIIKFKDGDVDIAKQLENLSDSYIVWNSGLFADEKGMAFFEYILISDNKIFCIVDNTNRSFDENMKQMRRIVGKKGLINEIVFIERRQEDFIKYMDMWKHQEIRDIIKQKEFVDILKSAAIK